MKNKIYILFYNNNIYYMKHARSPFRFPIWGFFAVILLIISIVFIIKISSKKTEGFEEPKTCSSQLL
jgi:hypothetical protein